MFPSLLFSFISLHHSLKKAFLSLLAILWNSALSWVYLSFFLCLSLLFFSQTFVRPPQTTTWLLTIFLVDGFGHHLMCITSCRLQDSQWQQQGQGALCSRALSNISSNLPRPPFPAPPSGPLSQLLATCWWTLNYQWSFEHSTRSNSGTTSTPGTSSSYAECLKVMSLLDSFWPNMAHCRKEWQTTSVFLPWEPHEQYENVLFLIVTI